MQRSPIRILFLRLSQANDVSGASSIDNQRVEKGGVRWNQPGDPKEDDGGNKELRRSLIPLGDSNKINTCSQDYPPLNKLTYR